MSAPAISTQPRLKATGRYLSVAGKRVFLSGLNSFELSTCYNGSQPNGVLPQYGGCGTQTLDSQVSAPFNQGAQIVRTWAFQSMGTAGQGNQPNREWHYLDRIVQAATNAGAYLIMTLGDANGTCDPGGQKGATWCAAQTYNSPAATDLTSYRQWVTDIVTRYAGNPAIGMWEPMNELRAGSDVDAYSVKGFFDDIGALIKSIDPNCLIASGVSGDGPAEQANSYRIIHSSNFIDVCTIHQYAGHGDYVYGSTSPAGDHLAGSQERFIVAGALGKPIIDEEEGADHNATPAAADAYRAAGGSGLLIWDWNVNYRVAPVVVPANPGLITLEQASLMVPHALTVGGGNVSYPTTAGQALVITADGSGSPLIVLPSNPAVFAVDAGGFIRSNAVYAGTGGTPTPVLEFRDGNGNQTRSVQGAQALAGTHVLSGEVFVFPYVAMVSPAPGATLSVTSLNAIYTPPGVVTFPDFIYAGVYGPEAVLTTPGGVTVNFAPNQQIVVFNDDNTTPATLYTDRTKVAKVAGNTVVTDAYSNLGFFADPGRYYVGPVGSAASGRVPVYATVDPKEGAPFSLLGNPNGIATLGLDGTLALTEVPGIVAQLDPTSGQVTPTQAPGYPGTVLYDNGQVSLEPTGTLVGTNGTSAKPAKYGDLYVASDGSLYYRDPQGTSHLLALAGVGLPSSVPTVTPPPINPPPVNPPPPPPINPPPVNPPPPPTVGGVPGANSTAGTPVGPYDSTTKPTIISTGAASMVGGTSALRSNDDAATYALIPPNAGRSTGLGLLFDPDGGMAGNKVTDAILTARVRSTAIASTGSQSVYFVIGQLTTAPIIAASYVADGNWQTISVRVPAEVQGEITTGLNVEVDTAEAGTTLVSTAVQISYAEVALYSEPASVPSPPPVNPPPVNPPPVNPPPVNPPPVTPPSGGAPGSNTEPNPVGTPDVQGTPTIVALRNGASSPGGLGALQTDDQDQTYAILPAAAAGATTFATAVLEYPALTANVGKTATGAALYLTLRSSARIPAADGIGAAGQNLVAYVEDTTAAASPTTSARATAVPVEYIADGSYQVVGLNVPVAVATKGTRIYLTTVDGDTADTFITYSRQILYTEAATVPPVTPPPVTPPPPPTAPSAIPRQNSAAATPGGSRYSTVTGDIFNAYATAYDVAPAGNAGALRSNDANNSYVRLYPQTSSTYGPVVTFDAIGSLPVGLTNDGQILTLVVASDAPLAAGGEQVWVTVGTDAAGEPIQLTFIPDGSYQVISADITAQVARLTQPFQIALATSAPQGTAPSAPQNPTPCRITYAKIDSYALRGTVIFPNGNNSGALTPPGRVLRTDVPNYLANGFTSTDPSILATDDGDTSALLLGGTVPADDPAQAVGLAFPFSPLPAAPTTATGFILTFRVRSDANVPLGKTFYVDFAAGQLGGQSESFIVLVISNAVYQTVSIDVTDAVKAFIAEFPTTTSISMNLGGVLDSASVAADSSPLHITQATLTTYVEP